MRQQADQKNRRAEKEAWHAAHRARHQGGEQSRSLGDGGPQHDDKDQPQGRKAGHGVGHGGQQLADIFRRKQTFGDQYFAIHRIDRAPAPACRSRRYGDQQRDQTKEDEDRVGQGIAPALDPVEPLLRLA